MAVALQFSRRIYFAFYQLVLILLLFDFLQKIPFYGLRPFTPGIAWYIWRRIFILINLQFIYQ